MKGNIREGKEMCGKYQKGRQSIETSHPRRRTRGGGREVGRGVGVNV